MLSFKIILFSLKIKIIKFFNYKYDPFNQRDDIYNLSPSNYFSDKTYLLNKNYLKYFKIKKNNRKSL